MFLSQCEYHSTKEICAEIVDHEKYSRFYSVKTFDFHSDSFNVMILIISLFFNLTFIYHVPIIYRNIDTISLLLTLIHDN